MRHFLWQIFRLSFWLIFIISYGKIYVVVSWQYIKLAFITHTDCYYGFITGLGAYVLFAMLPIDFVRNNTQTLRLLMHELTHAMFAVIMLGDVDYLYINRPQDSGYIATRKVPPNFLISLAPYFFPVITIILLVIRQFIIPDFYFAFDILIGFSYLFHITTFCLHISPYQTDLLRHGLLFSYLFILLMNIIFFAMIIIVLDKGFFAFFNSLGEAFVILGHKILEPQK